MSSKYQDRGRTLSFGLREEIHYVPFERKSHIPLFCPICNECISNNLDSEAYLRVECCRNCESEFAERDLASWKEGNRPSKDEVSFKIQERNQLIFERYVKELEKINVRR